jgi:myo-inositol-1(or 4)-monophosphatase
VDGDAAASGENTDRGDDVGPRDLEAIAIDVVVASARLVRSRLGRSRVVETKSTPTDVVTEADVEVETFIRDRLQTATPGAGFHGEERGASAGTTSIGWIVDPIDGTVNFLYDLPVVSVSIAATVAGQVVAGAVADVVRDEVFSAAAGRGAHRNGAPITPTTTSDLGDALVGTGFSYSADVRRLEGEIAARVLPAARDLRCFGSAALHLCWVACGRLDAYYQDGVKEWDVAAGAFVASEAGARVGLGGGSDGGLVIAATPAVFDQLRILVDP